LYEHPYFKSCTSAHYTLILISIFRFSQFFIAPLFDESAVEREVNAIHSEYSKNVLKDSWRFDQLQRSTAKETHDYNVHGGGNFIFYSTFQNLFFFFFTNKTLFVKETR